MPRHPWGRKKQVRCGRALKHLLMTPRTEEIRRRWLVRESLQKPQSGDKPELGFAWRLAAECEVSIWRISPMELDLENP
jgi:hypothetical protein